MHGNWHCIIYTLYGCHTVQVSFTLSNQYYKVHQELKSWVRVLIRMCSLYNLQWGEAGVCRAGASSGTFTLWGGARPSPLLPDVTPPQPWYNDTSAAGVLDKQIWKISSDAFSRLVRTRPPPLHWACPADSSQIPQLPWCTWFWNLTMLPGTIKIMFQ